MTDITNVMNCFVISCFHVQVLHQVWVVRHQQRPHRQHQVSHIMLGHLYLNRPCAQCAAHTHARLLSTNLDVKTFIRGMASHKMVEIVDSHCSKVRRKHVVYPPLVSVFDTQNGEQLMRIQSALHVLQWVYAEGKHQWFHILKCLLQFY